MDPEIFPIENWVANDFMVHSMVDLSPSPAPGRGRGEARGKKILNLKDALALIQPSLVKLPIVDAPRYKKVVRETETEGEKIVTLWQPFEFSSASKAQQANPQEKVEEKVEIEPEFPEEIKRRQDEMTAEVERKLEEANSTLEQAKIEADTVTAQAKEEAEKILAEAHQIVEQSRKQAYEEGMLSARLQVDKQLEQITVIIKETQTWRSQILEHSEPTIVRMVQSISKKLFGSGFVLDAVGVEQMVGRAINEANRLGNLRIYVNPEDHSLLLSLWQESDLVINGQKIQLVPSQNIVRGGCFVEGEFGSVDSRIDMQLERLERELNSTLTNREQEKQRQMEFSLAEKIKVEAKAAGAGNLDALDQVNLNLGTNQTPSDSSQENYGFNPIAQPE